MIEEKDIIIISENDYSKHFYPDGTPLYEEAYDTVKPFKNGAAIVSLGKHCFHIGLDGKRLYTKNYLDVGNFSDGWARVVEGSLVYFINNTGDMMTKDGKVLAFTDVRDFVNGFAVVYSGDGAYHMGTDGTPLYKNRFQSVSAFIDGLSCAKTSEGCFHIDISGKAIYDETFDMVNSFVNTTKGSVCVVRKNGTAYHINSDGDPLYEARYRDVGIFENNIAIVADFNGNEFHINLDGLPLYNARFMGVSRIKYGAFTAITSRNRKSSNKNWYGIDGNYLIPIEASKIPFIEIYEVESKKIFNAKQDIGLKNTMLDLIGFKKFIDSMPPNDPKTVFYQNIYNKYNV